MELVVYEFIPSLESTVSFPLFQNTALPMKPGNAFAAIPDI
jgi:hypothetical protein